MREENRGTDMLDKSVPTPLYAQLKEKLAAQIRCGRLAVGGQIPAENELMARFVVSRETVRKAIALLVSEGYLVKRRGIGTFVQGTSPSMGFEPLISLDASLHARGVNPHNVVVCQKTVVPDAGLLAQLRWRSPEACIYIRRIRYAESAPIGIEDSWFSREFLRVWQRCDLTGSLARIIIEDLGVEIVRIEQTIVPRVAQAAERKLLELPAKSRVLQLDRWILIRGRSTPFYTLRLVIPATLYTIQVAGAIP